MCTFMYQSMCKLVQHKFEPNLSRPRPPLLSSTTTTRMSYLKARNQHLRVTPFKLPDARGAVLLAKRLNTVMRTSREF